MKHIIRAMYPGCDTDPNGCFERYVRDRIDHMKAFGLTKLKIGTFTSTYDEQFKNIEKDHAGNFWWNPHSLNVGTVKDNYVYSFTLFYKDDKKNSKVSEMVTEAVAMLSQMNMDGMTAPRTVIHEEMPVRMPAKPKKASTTLMPVKEADEEDGLETID